MSDEIRINRQPQSNSRMEPQGQAMPQAAHQAPGSFRRMPWVVLGLVIVVLAVVCVLFRQQLFNGKPAGGMMWSSKAKYQSVFLTNGQVYFGKISNMDNNFVTLTDIYYLQVGPQQGSGTSTTTAQQEIHLVKLGQELHGPTDEMHISRQQILFYEDLKDDGQVVTAILKDKAAVPAK